MRFLLSTTLVLALAACGSRRPGGGDLPPSDSGPSDALTHGDGDFRSDLGGADGGGVDLGAHDGGGTDLGGTDGAITGDGATGACAMLAMCCARLTIPELHDGCVATAMAGNEMSCAELATSPMYCPPP